MRTLGPSLLAIVMIPVWSHSARSPDPNLARLPAGGTLAQHGGTLCRVTYWEIGRRIVEFEQEGQERAGYGEALSTQLADDLTGQFGRASGADNLRQMRG